MSSTESLQAGSFQIHFSVDQKDPAAKELVKKIENWYRLFDTKQWGKMYNFVSPNPCPLLKKCFNSKNSFIDWISPSQRYLRCKSYKLKQLIISENRAFITMDIKTSVKINTYDEWVFENGNWKLYRFFEIQKPKAWSKGIVKKEQSEETKLTEHDDQVEHKKDVLPRKEEKQSLLIPLKPIDRKKHLFMYTTRTEN